MQFVDGENLTIRGQSLLDSGKVDRLPQSARYYKDVFLWPGSDPRALGSPRFSELAPVRSFYYTSLAGDDDLRNQVRGQLWTLGFEPHVFKKAKQSLKAKGVDIALTKDMLSHGFRNNYDIAQLIAGDGDYVPLVEEVKRLGKRVVIRFFEESTHPELKLAVDHFEDIRHVLMNWQGSEEARGPQ